MADYGAEYADKKLRSVDKQLQKEYGQAEKELREKLAEFTAKSAARDKYKRKQLEAGIITEEEYQSWLKGQVFQKKRWEAKIRQMQFVLHSHNEQAAKMIHENKLDVYNENYFHQAYEMEMVTGASFDLYSTEAVTKLIRDRDQLLPEWKVDQKKDYNWNYDKVNNAVTQGILQGESVDKIMNRLAENLSSQNESKMRMFARTAITGAQNAGRQQQMTDAAKLGIEQLKQWLATLDSRTRDVHRHLDGQEVPFNESFDSDLGKIKYPGDPEAAPANVYNCRCTVITIYPKYRQEQDDWRSGETIDGLTYQQWKAELDKKRKDPNKAEQETQAREAERQKQIGNIIKLLEQNAFDINTPEEYRNIIEESIRNADKQMLDIIEKTIGNVKVNWLEECRTSCYTEGTGVITMKMTDSSSLRREPDEILRTFWHEYGHYVADSAISGSGYGYQNEYLPVFMHGIKAEILKDDRWMNAAAADTQAFLEKMGLADRYTAQARQSAYSAGIFKNDIWIDPRTMGFDDLTTLNNGLNEWVHQYTKHVDQDKWKQQHGYPVKPNRDDYVESYFTPKRNIYREREKFKGGKAAYEQAMREYYEKADEFERTHDMSKIMDEWYELEKAAQRREKMLSVATDSFDGGTGGHFSAHILWGGHDPGYYLSNRRGADEAIANVFSTLVIKDPDMIHAMEELCPETYSLIRGVILK